MNKRFLLVVMFLVACAMAVMLICRTQGDVPNNVTSADSTKDSTATAKNALDSKVTPDFLNRGHNVSLSDSLCVFMFQLTEDAMAICDYSGLPDSVDVMGGCLKGRIVGDLFFFYDNRYGFESIPTRGVKKYLKSDLVTSNPTETFLWSEKSKADSLYFKTIEEAVEVCTGSIQYPEITKNIITDMRMHGIIIPVSPDGRQIKEILDQYKKIETRSFVRN